MSTIKANQWLNSDGTENYKCRAWVNFNGTGTVAIRASGNVSSITDNGTGDWTVNFTNALADANYSVSISGKLDDTNGDGNVPGTGVRRASTAMSTTSVRVCARTATDNFTAWDTIMMSVAVFR